MSTRETTSRTRSRLARLLSVSVLGAVLAVSALVVPDSSVRPTDVVLVQTKRASGLDVDPDVVWILAVGSDARPGDSMTRTRGDALQLVGMNTRTGAATAIGIPRDSWVPIPGHGSNRVNAALQFGGPELLGKTVGDFVGIQPDYVFVTRFPFFENMINDIGGIHVQNPRYFSDSHLKNDGFKKGKVKLNGYDAMAFSRIRKTLAGGDFDRSANQQRVLRGIQRTVRANATKRGFLEKGVLTVMRNMSTTGVSPSELFALAHAVAAVKPGKVTSCVVQGGIGNIGGASVVIPNTSTARRYGDDARQDAVISRC